MDTFGYQVSDPEDVDFHWEDTDLNVDAIFRPVKFILFFHSKSNDSEMGSLTENPILVDEGKHKENSPPPVKFSL